MGNQFNRFKNKPKWDLDRKFTAKLDGTNAKNYKDIVARCDSGTSNLARIRTEIWRDNNNYVHTASAFRNTKGRWVYEFIDLISYSQFTSGFTVYCAQTNAGCAYYYNITIQLVNF